VSSEHSERVVILGAWEEDTADSIASV